MRPDVRAFGVGGPRLRAAGLETLYPAEDLNVMGIAEVLPKIPRILAVLRGLRRAAEERRPGVALLVDSPDFNLRLAKHLKRLGVKVVYYVSPMIWAWRRGRARKIAKVVDRMLCILPFEERFYEGTGVSARFVGHPFAERALPGDAASYRLGARPAAPAGPPSRSSRAAGAARSPGSSRPCSRRPSASASCHPDVQFVVPVAPTLDRGGAAPGAGPPRRRSTSGWWRAGPTRSVGASDAALVKSGTSTLETALMNRPMVVVYKMAWFTYWIARLLVRMSHFALVNILAGRTVVPELLQQEASPRAHGRRDRAAPLRPGRPAGRSSTGSPRCAARWASRAPRAASPRRSPEPCHDRHPDRRPPPPRAGLPAHLRREGQRRPHDRGHPGGDARRRRAGHRRQLARTAPGSWPTPSPPASPG